MNTSKVTVEFTGNVTNLMSFLEATFKDPNGLTLNVSAVLTAKAGKTPEEALVDECLKRMTGCMPTAREEFLKALPEIIEAAKDPNGMIKAIKAIRTATGCGLKEGKDAVEGPVRDYLNNKGGV